MAKFIFQLEKKCNEHSLAKNVIILIYFYFLFCYNFLLTEKNRQRN